MTKICAVITNTKDIEKARTLGCEAFEFRLDMFENPLQDLSFVFQPELTIVTVRSKEDESRRELFQKALDAGADFVDIESDSVLRGEFPGRTICSYHDFEKTPSAKEIVSIFQDLAKTGVPKAAFMVCGPRDLLEIADAAAEIRSWNMPFILIGMGDAGKITRVRAESLGSLVTYCAVSKETGSAPGQLTVKEAADLGQDAVICGVIGFPLTKTFSPAIHNAAFKKAGIRGTYVKIPTPEDEVSLVPQMMKVYDITGINVTIPHKQAVLSFLKSVSPAAKEIQAVNTITKNLEGDNTDWIGIAETLDRFEPKGKNVLLLGAGGAAFAAAFYFRERGAKLSIANRTEEKANALAKRFEGCSVKISELKPEYDIVLNASPVCPADPKSFVKEGTVVMDMVYPNSPMLDAARNLGAVTFSGETMLIHQGAAAFEKWHGVSPDILEMKKAFLEGE